MAASQGNAEDSGSPRGGLWLWDIKIAQGEERRADALEPSYLPQEALLAQSGEG